MSPRNKFLIALSLLIAATLACEYLPSPASDPEPAIATSVAATLAASEGEGSLSAPSPTDEVLIAPTSTSEPVPFRIVYETSGNLFLWEEGSPPTALLGTGDVYDVRLSEDANVVAFTRGSDWNNQELWAINIDGSNLRQLVNQATLETYNTHDSALTARIYSFSFKPGTHQVAFNTQLTFEGPGLYLNDDLRVVDADSLVLVTVLPSGTGGNFFYSPDGTEIGLMTPELASVVNADGTNRRDLLSFPRVITYSEYNYYPPITWIQNGSAIRVVIPPADPMAAAPDVTRIWHLPADGSPPSTLMSMSTVAFPLTTTTLSGNAERVAYLVEITPGSPPLMELHLANIDGSGDMIYATGPLRFFDWNTNGVYFIYTDASPNPKIGQYGIAPTSLGGVTKLIEVVWINETQFLYQSKNGANFELWLGELGTPGILIGSNPSTTISYDFSN